MASSEVPGSYRLYVSASPTECLKLGVEGYDAESSAARLLAAKAVEAEYLRVEERAYAIAHWMSEPAVPKPFGLQVLIDHGGDVVAALGDDRLRDEMRDHLGHQPHEVFIDDEDGQRWEWDDGGRDDQDVQATIDAALEDVRTGIGRDVDQWRLQAITDRWTEERAAVEAATPSQVADDQMPADDPATRGITR